MHFRSHPLDWYIGRPDTPNWYLTGHVNGKEIYRYWFGDAWSEAVTTDSHFESYKELGLKHSLMSACFDRYIPLKVVPEFLKPFQELIPATLITKKENV